MLRWLDNLPWLYLIVACLTLGLAPFVPEPHIVEKLRMLSQGTLHRPIDIFDLMLHGIPFVLAAIKGWRMMSNTHGDDTDTDTQTGGNDSGGSD